MRNFFRKKFGIFEIRNFLWNTFLKCNTLYLRHYSGKNHCDFHEIFPLKMIERHSLLHKSSNLFWIIAQIWWKKFAEKRRNLRHFRNAITNNRQHCAASFCDFSVISKKKNSFSACLYLQHIEQHKRDRESKKMCDLVNVTKASHEWCWLDVKKEREGKWWKKKVQ